MFTLFLLAAIAPAAQVRVPDADPPLSPTAATASWSTAATATLTWDVVHRQAAAESTVAYLATDGRALYVRFEARQREPIVADQHSNDVGQGSDDAVWIDLAPNGLQGYSYQFQVTPNGTHYASSSENRSYSPVWDSYGAVRPGGYTATMRIPLDVIRGVHAGNWSVQFVRYVRATGAEYVWSYDAAQTNPDDPARAGHAVMPVGIAGAASRPKPRVALYGLAQTLPAAYGGSTSRSGADISIPVTSTASFFATLHPDASNVELDQQSISPTVYQRYYNEVRPFFTQASNFYNTFNCNVCLNEVNLYTPGIPTPRAGFAIEGKQGSFGFAGFDAAGDGRSDVASVLDYTSGDTKWNGTIQRVSVNEPGLTDDDIASGISYYDLKHLSFYANAGHDSGTNVLDGSQAQWYDAGGGWQNQTFGVYGSLRKIGQYYNPVDGFFSHPGVAGYGLYAAKIFDFDANSKLESAGISAYLDRYQGPTQGSDQSDNGLEFDFLTKSTFDLRLMSGSDYWRFGDVLSPISQNAGIALTYHSGLETNNPGQFPNHGSSSTPTELQYYTGRYGDGRLDTWYRSTTMRAGARGLVTLTLDNTAQRMPRSPSNVQWFESFSYAYQLGANSSLSVGLRRVTGNPPVPNGGGNCIGVCSNVSVAYHLRLKKSELYFAYGNPNTLTTLPQVLLKMIFYAGAQKGT